MTATAVQPCFVFVCKGTMFLYKKQGKMQVVNANSAFFDVCQ